MHEASIAQSIVRTVLMKAQDRNATGVQRVELDIGQWTFLNVEQISFWVHTGFENTIAEKADLQIQEIPARFQCLHCGHEGPLPMKENVVFHFQVPVIACTKCGDQEITIVSGRDVIVRSIRIMQSNGKEL